MTSQTVVFFLFAVVLGFVSLFGPPADLAIAPPEGADEDEQTMDVLAVVEGDSVPLYASDDSNEVVVTLEKGESLVVIESSGPRYHVRTVNGIEGFVPRYLARPLSVTKAAQNFMVLGYYMQDTRGASLSSLEAGIDTLNAVSPWSWGLTADGDLRTVYFDERQLADVLSLAGRHGLTTHALVHNFNPDKGTFDGSLADQILANPAVRRRTVDTIVATVIRWGMSGVHIDFEGVAAARRDDLTSFMAELAESARAHNLVVSMAVPAKTAATEASPWVAAYDYASLARHTDFLMIMAYDQHWRGDRPGPVAAVPWVRDVIQYSLDPLGGAVPAHKLVLGIPAYGYDWPAGGQWADAVTYRQAISRIESALGQDQSISLQWHETHLAPYFTSAGRTIWFENEHSIAHKMMLALEYDLAGVALWRLGQEDPLIWETMKRMLH